MRMGLKGACHVSEKSPRMDSCGIRSGRERMPSRTRAFSISVDDSGRLAFAWMNGSDRGHGVVRFQDSIPAPLFSQLTDLIDDDRAAVRAA